MGSRPLRKRSKGIAILTGPASTSGSLILNSLDITGDITIVTWAKPEEVKTQDVVKKAVTTGTTVNGYEFDLSTTGTTCTPGLGPVRFRSVSTNRPLRITFELMQSRHTLRLILGLLYVVTYTGADNTLRIYKNGLLDNSRIVTGLVIATNTLYLGIGAQLAGTGPTASRWFHGSLDDIRIYKRALSAAEIKTLSQDVVPAGVSCTALQSQAGTAATGEKPQSKVWYYENKWWSVFPASSGVSSSGSWLWRLDGSAWTPVTQLSTSTTAKADVKPAGSPAGSLVHVLLYNGSSADLASVEYNAGVYQPWSLPLQPDFALPAWQRDRNDRYRFYGADVAGNPIQHRLQHCGNQWLMRSAAPYESWSSPITLATVTNNQDDISVITALPNNTVGVLWSNQNSKRFGFKYHVDTNPIDTWSADEVPASQSANDSVGAGMADDHLNLAAASDGTLYAAVKTGYDTAGYPKIAMLVRRLSGSAGSGVWDNLHGVERDWHARHHIAG